jgi:hypothetical protein
MELDVLRLQNEKRLRKQSKQKVGVSRDYELHEIGGSADFHEGESNYFITAMHVLIVDDSRMNRKMVSKFLKGDDYLCDEAEDGLEAIRLVQENLDKFESGKIAKPYHAILMDYMVRFTSHEYTWKVIYILMLRNMHLYVIVVAVRSYF